MLLHSMWKSCASQKVESNQLHLCYNDIIIIATTNCSNCSTILSFYCYCKTDKNQKNPRWLATNECTIDEMKILYILPITTIMMLVMSRNKRTQKVLLSFKRFFNNVEAKKGPKKFTFLPFVKKKIVHFWPLFLSSLWLQKSAQQLVQMDLFNLCTVEKDA